MHSHKRRASAPAHRFPDANCSGPALQRARPSPGADLIPAARGSQRCSSLRDFMQRARRRSPRAPSGSIVPYRGSARSLRITTPAQRKSSPLPNRTILTAVSTACPGYCACRPLRSQFRPRASGAGVRGRTRLARATSDMLILRAVHATQRICGIHRQRRSSSACRSAATRRGRRAIRRRRQSRFGSIPGSSRWRGSR